MEKYERIFRSRDRTAMVVVMRVPYPGRTDDVPSNHPCGEIKVMEIFPDKEPKLLHTERYYWNDKPTVLAVGSYIASFYAEYGTMPSSGGIERVRNAPTRS